jgi:predicted dehydrogenase
MLDRLELDAVQINTPDHLHCAPTLAALERGLDVVLPKPAAATVREAHAMLQAARSAGRFIGVDFHKREDPRIKEARARYRSGRYGQFQAAVFYMLDKLLVADPNHDPRFFVSPDFAAKNTPVSFLTVHMADALMCIVGVRPRRVRALGYAHKLPSLRPLPVQGYDLVDTEIIFETGAVAHILTGWALPNSAWATTVQSSRLICSEGMLDLGLDTPGLREIHPSGVIEVNPLFRNFESGGMVSGYGITSPGTLYEQILEIRQNGGDRELLGRLCSPELLGFYTTLILEAAERSLAHGEKLATGATIGAALDLSQLLHQELGPAANDYL